MTKRNMFRELSQGLKEMKEVRAMRKVKVYVVWTLEDSDTVDMFTDVEKAEALYKEFGEFGMWHEQTLEVDDE